VRIGAGMSFGKTLEFLWSNKKLGSDVPEDVIEIFANREVLTD
jgi:hypothetical protein